MKALVLPFFLFIVGLPLSAQPVGQVVGKPTAVKRIYLANDDHTDYMWTANEAQYDSAYVKMLDYYMAQIDSTKAQPNDFQTRWNCDGSFWLRRYEQLRSPAQFERLIGYVRSGHISSPLNSVVSTYGGQPTEAVLRGMFYAGRLERQHGIRFPMAVAMEDQTMPLGLASLWAGSGARYSWKGVCNCATRIGHRLRVRQHQLYRYMGLDGQGVLMKWYNIPGENTSLGGYAETRQEKKVSNVLGSLTKTVDDLTALCDTTSAGMPHHRSPYPYNIAGAFGYGWDDLETYNAPAFGMVARQTSNATRRVRVSNEEDFFRDVERTYKTFPTQTVSFGNEWDLYPASMNETTAEVRRATEKLRSAEALATLVSLRNPAFGQDLKPAKEAAWDAFGLYWEHNWTADGPITRQERGDWQIRQKNAIVAYVDTLHNRAATALGTLLKPADAPTANGRFFVFNPLSWIRSDVADFPYTNASPVKVVDLTTGAEAASQFVQKNGRKCLRIWAENVPSVGYKVYEIRPGTPTPKPDAAQVSGQPGATEFIQNDGYRLRLRRSGIITDLTDLRAGPRQAGGRQVVRPNAARADSGRWFNDLGTKNPDAGEPVVVENRGPVSVTLRAVSPDPIPHTVRVTFYRKAPNRQTARIEIEDSIQANFGDAERGPVKSWAFSLNLNNPTTRHEELGTVLTAKSERRGGHYAAQNGNGGPGRYDWLTFNHFADLSEPNYGVTLSTGDCSFFRLGHSTPDSLWENSAQLNALAGGQVDGPKLGITNQHGATAFRYSFALTTHQTAFDPVVATRFALEHQNPLVTGAVTGASPTYPEKSYSLLTISDPNVVLWALKPAEEGAEKGIIARFSNLTNKPVSAIVATKLPLSRVWKTSHIETDEAELKPGAGPLKLPLMPQQLASFRFLTL
jgi:alpha-mannosidase